MIREADAVVHPRAVVICGSVWGRRDLRDDEGRRARAPYAVTICPSVSKPRFSLLTHLNNASSADRAVVRPRRLVVFTLLACFSPPSTGRRVRVLWASSRVGKHCTGMARQTKRRKYSEKSEMKSAKPNSVCVPGAESQPRHSCLAIEDYAPCEGRADETTRLKIQPIFMRVAGAATDATPSHLGGKQSACPGATCA